MRSEGASLIKKGTAVGILFLLMVWSGPSDAMEEWSSPERTLERTPMTLASIHPPEKPEPDASPGQAPESSTDSSVVLADIYFDEDRYVISQGKASLLEETVRLLKSEKNRELHIESHCDERGTGAYSIILGDRRIQGVKEFLLDLGVEPHRVWTTSYGQTKPLCRRSTTRCREENLRVQLGFQVLAPRHSYLGCLIRLRLITQEEPRNAVQHLLQPPFLQPLRLATFPSPATKQASLNP